MDDTNINEGKKKKIRGSGAIDRMLKAYKKRKRKQKIEKLLDNDDHWKGLS